MNAFRPDWDSEDIEYFLESNYDTYVVNGGMFNVEDVIGWLHGAETPSDVSVNDVMVSVEDELGEHPWECYDCGNSFFSEDEANNCCEEEEVPLLMENA